jgi:hypothetical protein
MTDTTEQTPRAARRWPLWLLGAPAVVAIWSGWVGLGQMAGFGVVHPLPGIADGFELNTAITLPVGVEAYSAYALGAWLSPARLHAGARTFAKRSALASLGLGLIGQVLYHLLTSWGYQRAPVGVVVFVACLPVLVLGAGATLHHLLATHTPEDTTGPPAALPTQVSTEVSTGADNSTSPAPAGEQPAVLAPPRTAEVEVSRPAEPDASPGRPVGKPTSRRTARKPVTKPARAARRRLFPEFLAEARRKLADAEAGTDPSPSWCQRVTGCSAGTSVNLARALRAELTNTPTSTDGPAVNPNAARFTNRPQHRQEDAA